MCAMAGNHRSVIRLEFPPAAEFVSVPRSAVGEIASKLPFSPEEIDDLKLAVGEACSNAVKYSGPKDAPVHVLCKIEPDKLVIEVRNAGEPIRRGDHLSKRPSIQDLHEGGLGLYLISQITDDLKITHKDGENTIRMTKRLPS